MRKSEWSEFRKHCARPERIVWAVAQHEDRRSICPLGWKMNASHSPVMVPVGVSPRRFTHDLIRQAAYERTDPEARRRWHRRAGLALERHAPGRVEALAHHFWQGQVWDQAAAYSLAAGDRARQVYALNAAQEQFGRVVEL